MNERIHAARVLTRRRVQEALLGPGFYIAMTVGLLTAYFLVSGFVQAVDSSGFDYTNDPVYDIIGRSLEAAFGATLVDQLFAEGPFLFALYVGFLPMLLYLAVASVFRIGLERKIGALQLISCGPADGTAVVLATLVANVLLTMLSLAVMLTLFLVMAGLYNLAVGPTFLFALVVMLFLSFAVYGYGMLASTLTENSASAIALFLALLVFFVVIAMGSFTIVSGYVSSVSAILASVVQWFSPLFYWTLALGAVEVRNWFGYVGSLLVFIVLGSTILTASHFVLKFRGVRP